MILIKKKYKVESLQKFQGKRKKFIMNFLNKHALICNSKYLKFKFKLKIKMPIKTKIHK